MATDPSDWKFTPLREMDSLLRCPICFEYLTTAVMLPSCSHNYCSLCIRRFLAHKQKCPTCSVPVGEADLKCNRLLDELVLCFTGNRRGLMALSQLSMLGTCEKEGVPPGTSGRGTRCEGGEVLGEEETGKSEWRSRRGGRRKDGEKVKEDPPLPVPPPEMKAEKMRMSNALSHTNGWLARDVGRLSEIITKDTCHVPESPTIANIELSLGDLDDSEGSATPPLQSLSTPTLFVSVTTPRTPRTTNPSLELDSEEVICRPPLKIRRARKKAGEAIGRVEEVGVSLGKDGRTGSVSGSTPLVSADRPAVDVRATAGPTERSRVEGKGGASSGVDAGLLEVVECPVCGMQTKASLINAHLDRCLSDPFPTHPSPSNPPPATLPPSQVLPKLACSDGIIYKRGTPLPRLPKIVFSIMKDRELRKKLKSYHLPTHGQRPALIGRLQEFTLQYKAQQDSLCPKSVKEIAEGIEKAEKKLSSMKSAALNSSTSATQVFRRIASPSDIEEERKIYVEKHGDQFAQLISSMSERRAVAATRDSATEIQASMKDRGAALEGVGATDSVLAGESSSESNEELWATFVEEEEEEEEDITADTILTGTIPESPTPPENTMSCQPLYSSSLTPTSPRIFSHTSHLTPSTSSSKHSLPPSPPSPSLLHILEDAGEGVVSTKRPRLQQGRDVSERLPTPPPRTRSRCRRPVI